MWFRYPQAVVDCTRADVVPNYHFAITHGRQQDFDISTKSAIVISKPRSFKVLNGPAQPKFAGWGIKLIEFCFIFSVTSFVIGSVAAIPIKYRKGHKVCHRKKLKAKFDKFNASTSGLNWAETFNTSDDCCGLEIIIASPSCFPWDSFCRRSCFMSGMQTLPTLSLKLQLFK